MNAYIEDKSRVFRKHIGDIKERQLTHIKRVIQSYIYRDFTTLKEMAFKRLRENAVEIRI